LTLRLIIKFNKYALAGAHICRQDHIGHVSIRHLGKGPRPARVIQWFPPFGHVRDAIFHLHKDIWAMVNTQAIPRAEVLVNPYAHA
jgi:hypothetical protein